MPVGIFGIFEFVLEDLSSTASWVMSDGWALFGRSL